MISCGHNIRFTLLYVGLLEKSSNDNFHFSVYLHQWASIFNPLLLKVLKRNVFIQLFLISIFTFVAFITSVFWSIRYTGLSQVIMHPVTKNVKNSISCSSFKQQLFIALNKYFIWINPLWEWNKSNLKPKTQSVCFSK